MGNVMNKKSNTRASAASGKGKNKPMLSKEIVRVLENGMLNGFNDCTLNLQCRGINDNMMPELCEWIIKIGDKIKILKVSASQINLIGIDHHEEIGDGCMNSLGEYVKLNNSIEEIEIGHTGVSDAGIETLVPYLEGNSTLNAISFQHNDRITEKSISILSKMIESSSIQELNIDHTSITQKSEINISLAHNIIKYGSDSIEIYSKGITDDDLIRLCGAMREFGIDKLKEIQLNRNKITSKGASMLFDTLKECNSVVSCLSLSGNQIDDDCIKKLGEYLQNNKYIEGLFIANSQISDKGIEILSGYLLGNTVLKELDFSWAKQITDSSTSSFIEIVNNSYIDKIYISGTEISMNSKKEITDLLGVAYDKREMLMESNAKPASKRSSSSSE